MAGPVRSRRPETALRQVPVAGPGIAQRELSGRQRTIDLSLALARWAAREQTVAANVAGVKSGGFTGVPEIGSGNEVAAS